MTSANSGSKIRLFTAEKRIRQRNAGDTGSALPKDFYTPEAVSNADLLSAIEGIYAELRARSQSAPTEAADQSGAPDASPNAEAEADLVKHNDMELLRTELHALSQSIENTKREISALRPPSSNDDQFVAVAEELDAVVNATETATESILEAAETIDNLAQSIQSQSENEVVRKIGDDIVDQTIKVFEACNFQDLSGQRITKVVNTLKFIEDRVQGMIEIWGEDAISAAHRDPNNKNLDLESSLLNGPQMESVAISQDDIDALFD